MISQHQPLQTHRSPGPPPTRAVLISRSGALAARVARTLVEADVPLDRVDPSRPIDRPDSDLHEAFIVVLTPRPGRGRRLHALRARFADNAEDTLLTEAVLAATTETDNCRILVLGDECDDSVSTRRLRRRARGLAQRIGYETEINGTTVDSVNYLLVGETIPTTQALAATRAWFRGRAAALGPRRRRSAQTRLSTASIAPPSSVVAAP